MTYPTTSADRRSTPPALVAKQELMTTREAAAYMRSSIADLAKLRHHGGGPVYIKKSARKVLYRLADLDAWLASKAFASTSAEAAGTVAQVAA